MIISEESRNGKKQDNLGIHIIILDFELIGFDLTSICFFSVMFHSNKNDQSSTLKVVTGYHWSLKW